MDNCYMCNKPKTSVEHAPPKSFFPKDHRVNLITVPSCISHNENTSSDDEYARNIITVSINNNQKSIDQFFSKSLKSFKRNKESTNKIVNSFINADEITVGAKAFRFDRARFDRVIRKIAYALYYSEYGKTWNRLLAVLSNQIKNADLTNDSFGDMFDEMSDDLNSLPLKGENPQIFQYSIIKFDSDENDIAIFMIFYEGFPMLVIPDRNSGNNSFD
ncbi:TPA: hypothetical protein ACG0AR_000376 [Elizabethkingia anophelis]